MHRGKVDPGVSELPRGNELSRDHVNRPLDKQKCFNTRKENLETRSKALELFSLRLEHLNSV